MQRGVRTPLIVEIGVRGRVVRVRRGLPDQDLADGEKCEVCDSETAALRRADALILQTIRGGYGEVDESGSWLQGEESRFDFDYPDQLDHLARPQQVEDLEATPHRIHVVGRGTRDTLVIWGSQNGHQIRSTRGAHLHPRLPYIDQALNRLRVPPCSVLRGKLYLKDRELLSQIVRGPLQQSLKLQRSMLPDSRPRLCLYLILYWDGADALGDTRVWCERLDALSGGAPDIEMARVRSEPAPPVSELPDQGFILTLAEAGGVAAYDPLRKGSIDGALWQPGQTRTMLVIYDPDGRAGWRFGGSAERASTTPKHLALYAPEPDGPRYAGVLPMTSCATTDLDPDRVLTNAQRWNGIVGTARVRYSEEERGKLLRARMVRWLGDGPPDQT